MLHAPPVRRRTSADTQRKCGDCLPNLNKPLCNSQSPLILRHIQQFPLQMASERHDGAVCMPETPPPLPSASRLCRENAAFVVIMTRRLRMHSQQWFPKTVEKALLGAA